MTDQFPAFFPIAYFGSKYVMIAFFLWCGIHFWVTGKIGAEKSTKYYDFRPWLNRHPVAWIALAIFAAGVILFVMEHLTYDAQVMYFRMLMAGSPVLYSWQALFAVALGTSTSAYMYWRREHKLAGAVSFFTVMLVACLAPYYFPL